MVARAVLQQVFELFERRETNFCPFPGCDGSDVGLVFEEGNLVPHCANHNYS